MYATMGTGDTILMTDTYFNEALRAIKEDVSTGKINLKQIFIIILWNQLHLSSGVWTT